MRADVLIVGQGIAGTLLAWQCEQRGIRFEIAEAGDGPVASAVSAGLINPITGRRLVKSWRVDELLPRAREAYRGIEGGLGVCCWHELRIHRLFADEREQRTAAAKFERGELEPYATAIDARGFWIERAARVDVGALLAAARTHWQQSGHWRRERMDPRAATQPYAQVIDCRGQGSVAIGAFGFVPWAFSKGELLEIDVDGLEPGVGLNCRQWVLPRGNGTALVGATHEPGVSDPAPTARGRAQLEAAAEALLQRPFAVRRHEAGVRVMVPDKRPVAGPHPETPRLGIINALGAKGVLWAPWLAEQWTEHLVSGAPFDPDVDVRRFAAGDAPVA